VHLRVGHLVSWQFQRRAPALTVPNRPHMQHNGTAV